MPVRDLTRPIESDMPAYPGDPPVRVDAHATHEREGYRVSELRFGSHTGTHVDAPSHTEPSGKTLGAYPVETFAFAAYRLDCRNVGARGRIRRSTLPPADVLTDVDLLVLDTGWADTWGTERMFDHPFLSQTAAERCAALGCHVATDALSVDPTPSRAADEAEPSDVPAHHALLGRELLIVENLASLDGVPERFELRAYPLALDADGSPVRAVAVYD